MVKKQKDIIFINDCNAVFDESELANAILWYQSKPTVSVKHVYLHGKYPAVSIFHEKIHIHRLLMQFWLGAKLPANFTVHHIDCDKLNASKDNLCVIFSRKHQSMHNQNKILSTEHRAKISKNNCRRKGIRHRPTRPEITPNMVGEMYKNGKSISRISKELGLDWRCVRQRIHDNPTLLEGRSNGN